jgi:hypothetical protein
LLPLLLLPLLLLLLLLLVVLLLLLPLLPLLPLWLLCGCAFVEADNALQLCLTFHVCSLHGFRKDEDGSRGLFPKSARTPYRLEHSLSTPAINYLNAVNDHIFNGNKGSCMQPFISATMQLKTALSYSYYGCHKIVEIDLAKCAAAGVLALDMGDSMNSLCWGGQPQHFAFASREVVLCGEVPADCVKLLKVGRACQLARPQAFGLTTAANKPNAVPC